jgi:uncharacterized lipoprotein YbaY
MTVIRAALVLATLALAATALPAMAQDPIAPPIPPSVVSGTIVLPDVAALPEGAIVIVEIQDTAVADAPATRISSLVMEATGATSPFPFSVSLIPTTLQDQGVYTLSIRVEAADGTLLYINDTVTPAIDSNGPITDVVAKLIAVAAPA